MRWFGIWTRAESHTYPECAMSEKEKQPAVVGRGHCSLFPALEVVLMLTLLRFRDSGLSTVQLRQHKSKREMVIFALKASAPLPRIVTGGDQATALPSVIFRCVTV